MSSIYRQFGVQGWCDILAREADRLAKGTERNQVDLLGENGTVSGTLFDVRAGGTGLRAMA